ncbi:MAG: DNA methyltransferase [Prosthecobacter sp.]|uniref:DNA methyltransferase n=1 Tax=Prosthecobacter sp. TaxID=1965333 RepID=UPI003BB1C36F
MGKLAKNTRLNLIMPYPAMIADELAVAIAQKHIHPGDLVLDPFVGTGRILAAAAQAGASGVGIDVNPLAVIVTNAKSVSGGQRRLRDFALELTRKRFPADSSGIRLLMGRRVEWFHPRTHRQIDYLKGQINRAKLPRAALTVVVAVFFATIREVSYCRKDQWKLHRLSKASRNAQRVDVKQTFLRRLSQVINSFEVPTHNLYKFRAVIGDSKRLSHVLSDQGVKFPIDCVVTSPPYGDSKSTVQYGGISQLCLEMAKGILGLKALDYCISGIDANCLGGKMSLDGKLYAIPKRIWAGDLCTSIGKRVAQYLDDMRSVCEQIVRVLKANGKIVFVVARRNVGGATLNLDLWFRSEFEKLGCTLIEWTTREIKRKLTPYLVVPKARSVSCETEMSAVPTMRKEYILVFSSPNHLTRASANFERPIPSRRQSRLPQ